MSETSTVWKLPANAPSPAELADAWSREIAGALHLGATAAERAADPLAPKPFDPTAPARAFGEFAAHLWSNPVELLKAQQKAAADWMQLWSGAAARATGAKPEPAIAPVRGDRRFNDPAWSEEPVFDYLKQAYLLTAKRALELVEEAEGLDEGARARAGFFTQQYLNAISPANFAFTNPEAIRRAIDTGSISLLSGLANLLADAAGDGGLPQRRASEEFELGVTLAATPGSVVYQNELMQLIQYAPATDEAYRRPLLYIPPLVNKYYLLDLQPKSSLIRWLVEQGHSVFVVSWVNPGPELADMDIADYIKLGPVAALDAIEQATGEREVTCSASAWAVPWWRLRSLIWPRRGRAAASPRRRRSARCSISAGSANGRPSPSPSSCGRWSGTCSTRGSWPRRTCRLCSARCGRTT